MLDQTSFGRVSWPLASPAPGSSSTRPISCTVPQSTTGTLPQLLPLLNTSVTASWQGQSAKVNICLEYVLQASHLHTEAGGARLHLSLSCAPSPGRCFPAAPQPHSESHRWISVQTNLVLNKYHSILPSNRRPCHTCPLIETSIPREGDNLSGDFSGSGCKQGARNQIVKRTNLPKGMLQCLLVTLGISHFSLFGLYMVNLSSPIK